jgi:transposase
MLTLPQSVKIYLASGPTDMRRGIDGLAGVVRTVFNDDPLGGHLFVFVSRRQDRVKILLFDHGGFVTYYKRLEAGKFRVPPVPSGATRIELEAADLAMLLRGIDFSRVRRPLPWLPKVPPGDTSPDTPPAATPVTPVVPPTVPPVPAFSPLMGCPPKKMLDRF